MTATPSRRTARKFWQFYRGYVDTPIHAVSAAALAIFGILVFVDPLFALLAIASYIVPPIVLFSIGWSRTVEPSGEPVERPSRRASQNEPAAPDRVGRLDTNRVRGVDSGTIDGDTDSDSDDGDTDTDSDDGDTDSDTDS